MEKDMFKIKDLNGEVLDEFQSVYDAHWKAIDIVDEKIEELNKDKGYIRVFPLNGELNYSVGRNAETATEDVLLKISGEEPITQIPYNLFVHDYHD